MARRAVVADQIKRLTGRVDGAEATPARKILATQFSARGGHKCFVLRCHTEIQLPCVSAIHDLCGINAAGLTDDERIAPLC